MRRTEKCVFSTLFFGAWIGVYTLCQPLFAQNRPVELPELQALSKLPEAQQRQTSNQARLQQWFLERIEAYYSGIRSTLIGGIERLVIPGPPATLPLQGLFGKSIAAPSGSGNYSILWGNVRTIMTDPPGGGALRIQVPLPALDLDGGGELTACWEEALHTLLNPHELSVDPAPYLQNIYWQQDYDYSQNQHHVYIECAARTFSWLKKLKGFEKDILNAADLVEELKNHPEFVGLNTYEVERATWAKAHSQWKTLWATFQEKSNKPPSIPRELRQEFETLAGVRVPFTEDVIRFYMSGEAKIPQEPGFKHPGKPVAVPEWVMWPDKLMVPPIIFDEGRKPPEPSGDDIVSSFRVWVLEMQRNRPPLGRGILTFWLQTENPAATLEVSLDGKPLGDIPSGGPGRRCSKRIDLGTPETRQILKREPRFLVKVTLKDALKRKPNSRDEILPLHVAYEDPGKGSPEPLVPGIKGVVEAIYAPAEAIFLMTIKGTPALAAGTASMAADGPSSTGGPVPDLVTPMTETAVQKVSEIPASISVPVSQPWVANPDVGKENTGTNVKFRKELKSGGGSPEAPSVFCDGILGIRLIKTELRTLQEIENTLRSLSGFEKAELSRISLGSFQGCIAQRNSRSPGTLRSYDSWRSIGFRVKGYAIKGDAALEITGDTYGKVTIPNTRKGPSGSWDTYEPILVKQTEGMRAEVAALISGTRVIPDSAGTGQGTQRTQGTQGTPVPGNIGSPAVSEPPPPTPVPAPQMDLTRVSAPEPVLDKHLDEVPPEPGEIVEIEKAKPLPPGSKPKGATRKPLLPDDFISIFDGINLPGKTKGKTASWEVLNGELHVRHLEGIPFSVGDDPKMKDAIVFSHAPVEKAAVELEAKIVTGGFWMALGYRQEDGEKIPRHTAGIMLLNRENLEVNTWRKFRLEFDGEKAILSVQGKSPRPISLKNPGKGVVALGICQGCEVYFRNITLRQSK